MQNITIMYAKFQHFWRKLMPEEKILLELPQIMPAASIDSLLRPNRKDYL